jgi:uncharacterized protein YutE (UPF0331/DUF86 family)
VVDRDVALAKLATIDRCLARIQAVTGGDPDSLANLDTQEIFLLNVQRAAQSALDLASHIVADESLGLPETLRDTFGLLREHGVIEESLADSLMRMVAFRNLAVHDYERLDPGVLRTILTERLGDLSAFGDAVKALLRR